MEPTLDYASAGVGYLPAVSGRRRVLRVFLWITYYVCWVLVSGFAGTVGLGVFGQTAFENHRGPFQGDDDFWVIGAILGLTLGVVVAWRFRRFRLLHLASIVIGVGGIIVMTVMGMNAYAKKQWLWGLLVLILAVCAGAFLMLVIAGISGLLLRRAA